ncbi:MAG: hypothetical protein JNM78_11935 [Cyclobacteriaceae bacterium]|nr:hypothetical protein [Cyclobacteriaceae bacterium]
MRAKFLFIAVLSFITITSFSQAKSAVTDEELTKYATVMDSIDEMSIAVKTILSDMVASSEVVNNARYNELSKIINDKAKLKEAEATPEEIAFINEVAEKKKTETAKINKAFQSLVKDNLGGAAYNKVKKALASDAALKAKYDALMEEMAKDNGVAVEEAG